MAKAASTPASSDDAHDCSEWWVGPQILTHLEYCPHFDMALTSLGYEIAAGTAKAKPMQAFHPGSGGRPKLANVPEITPDLWWRIAELGDAEETWRSCVVKLPATGNEKAVHLIGLRVRASDVRRVADAHGYAPPPKVKTKEAGGISCRAHGVVVATLTLDLLKQDREHVLGLTGINLKPQVQKIYDKVERRKLSDQNAGRVANGLLEVVRAHLLLGSEHSGHQVADPHPTEV